MEHKRMIELLKDRDLRKVEYPDVKDRDIYELISKELMIQDEVSYYIATILASKLGAKHRKDVMKYALEYLDITTDENRRVEVVICYVDALIGEYEFDLAKEHMEEVMENNNYIHQHTRYSEILYKLGQLPEAITYLENRLSYVLEHPQFENERRQEKLVESIQLNLDKYKSYGEIGKRYIPSTSKGKEKVGITSTFSSTMIPTLQGTSFIAFDFETTGFSASSNEVIDIGAVKVVDGIIVDTFQAFIKPRKAIPPHITKITNITNDMVKDAECLQQVLPRFIEFIKGSILVGHNVAFDLRFLESACNKMYVTLDAQAMDTLQLARTYETTTSYKLVDLATLYDIQLQDAHRALPDASATAELYLKLYHKFK